MDASPTDVAQAQAWVLADEWSPAGGVLFLELTDTTLARAWLAGVRGEIRSAGQALASLGARGGDAAGDARVTVGLGLSAWGLQALGIPHRELAAFPRWFRDGLATVATSIGLDGLDGPEHWRLPFRRVEPDAVLLVRAVDDVTRALTIARWSAELGAHGIVIVDQVSIDRPVHDPVLASAPMGRLLGPAPPPMPSWVAGAAYLQLVWRSSPRPGGGRAVELLLDHPMAAEPVPVPPAPGARTVAAGAFLVPSIAALEHLAELRTIS